MRAFLLLVTRITALFVFLEEAESGRSNLAARNNGRLLAPSCFAHAQLLDYACPTLHLKIKFGLGLELGGCYHRLSPFGLCYHIQHHYWSSFRPRLQ